MTQYKNPKDLHTTANILGISVMSVRRLIESGQIIAHKIGPKKAIRISMTEIERYIEKSRIDIL